MPVIDYDSLVPLDAGSLQTAIVGFMGLSIIGAILVFKIGLRLGPVLVGALARVVSRPGSLDAGDDEAEVLRSRDLQLRREWDEETARIRASVRNMYGQEWGQALSQHRINGEIGPLTDSWDGLADSDNQDEFREWLEEHTDSHEEADAIGDEISRRSEGRYREAWRANSRAQDADWDERAAWGAL